MDTLFTPWRFAYVTTANNPGDCVFCGLIQAKNDEQALIVHRAKYCFVVLNAFPYTSGHAMVVPYEHVDQLQKLSSSAAEEMMALTQRLEGVLREIYRPGRPQSGNESGQSRRSRRGQPYPHAYSSAMVRRREFHDSVGETRVLPEDLPTTYKRIREKF